ncbi:hypothetical protein T08_10747 [Trichinella sp. T8]|nr:hypothetical protein T08_10747 [Trichinella sp. T8]
MHFFYSVVQGGSNRFVMAETTYHMLNKFFLEASFKTWRIFYECISRRLGERCVIIYARRRGLRFGIR